jgi:small subunit ribosomal protein S27Ae
MAAAKASKKKKTSAKYKAYSVVGGKLQRKNRFCPKCGVSVFMAKHSNRETCGKCGYTEIVTVKKENKK